MLIDYDPVKEIIWPSFAGEWVSHPGIGLNVIKINQQGSWLEATYVTSFYDTVSAGQITWRANLLNFKGEGQVSEADFRNPRFIPGELSIISFDRIMFVWLALRYKIEYRRDD